MKKSIRWTTIIAVISTVFLFTAQVSASSTTGSWVAYPGQSVSTSTTTSTHTVYQATVRAPINLDGSSNWPKKRGVIPVQFDLSSATATDTITTTTTGPFIFESILSDANPDNDYSYVSFTPGSAMTFDDITNLSAVYDFTTGDCYGGSLRWSVRIDVSDTPSDPLDDPAIFIYYGTPPNFGNGGIGGCDDANNQSNTNMINQPDLRYDTTQLGGPFYDTYGHALILAGTHAVSRASLVLDSGWVATQVVDFTSATVNDNTFTPLPEGTTVTATTTVGSFSPTCDLHAAKLQWSKTDPYPDGSINEGESIQPRDTGEFYRIVDCKYIYNLDVNSLDPNLATRGGTYFVYVEIDGTLINNPAKFDLK